MITLNKLRITKFKCPSCGSRDKRIAILSNKYTEDKIGFSTICCNCGNVKLYMFQKKDKNKLNENIISCFNGNNIVSNLFCAIPHPFCENKSCPLYNSRIKKELSFHDIEKGKYDIVKIQRIPEGEINKEPEKGKFI